MKHAAIAKHVFPEAEFGAVEGNEIRLGKIVARRIEPQADVIFVVDASLFGDNSENLDLEFRGGFFTLVWRFSGVPVLQERVLLFRLGQVFVPAGERFRIQGSIP